MSPPSWFQHIGIRAKKLSRPGTAAFRRSDPREGGHRLGRKAGRHDRRPPKRSGPPRGAAPQPGRLLAGFFPGAPDLTLPSRKQGCYSGRPPSSPPDKHSCFVSFLHLYFAFQFLIRVRSALGRAAPGRQESWALGHLCHPATPQRHLSAQQTSRTQDLLKGIRRPQAFRMPSPVSNHCDRFCKDTSLRPRKRGHPPAHRARVVADGGRRGWGWQPAHGGLGGPNRGRLAFPRPFAPPLAAAPAAQEPAIPSAGVFIFFFFTSPTFGVLRVLLGLQ